MKMHITCNYCDHKWIENVYYKQAIEGRRCAVCRDKSLKIREFISTIIDTYVNCKPFETKTPDDTVDKSLPSMGDFEQEVLMFTFVSNVIENALRLVAGAYFLILLLPFLPFAILYWILSQKPTISVPILVAIAVVIYIVEGMYN